MDLKDVAESYIGGQIEIQNSIEEYMYRGEIKTLAVDDKDLRVELAWNAKAEGGPPIPKRWVKDDRLDYALTLEMCSISDIGDGRTCINSVISNETVVLFPKGGSKLDPADVEGLDVKVESKH